MKELICIVCPKGCHLKIEEENNYAVTGNMCQRGIAYGKEECTAPKRLVTSTVAVSGGMYPRISVKTNAQVPKELVFKCVKSLENIILKAPLKIGDIALENVCSTGVDFIITRNMQAQ